MGRGYLHGTADWHVLYSIASTKRRISRMLDFEPGPCRPASVHLHSSIRLGTCNEEASYACRIHKRCSPMRCAFLRLKDGVCVGEKRDKQGWSYSCTSEFAPSPSLCGHVQSAQLSALDETAVQQSSRPVAGTARCPVHGDMAQKMLRHGLGSRSMPSPCTSNIARLHDDIDRASTNHAKQRTSDRSSSHVQHKACGIRDSFLQP